MSVDCDALVVGAGAAGAATSILLALAGWRVVLAEQHRYPRRKVCGECIAPGNLPVLDALGVGAQFQTQAGPEIRRVGWMDGATTITADMPACSVGAYPYGRALGRDRLDPLLLERARTLGVRILQPAKVRSVAGAAGSFQCSLELSPGEEAERRGNTRILHAPVVIDAHGSWERGPLLAAGPAADPHAPSDLFAFKANFRGTSLAPGLLPVLALRGGYGGMVVGDGGRTTVACCLRRDVLAACRTQAPGRCAGDAVEAFLRHSCAGVRNALQHAQRDGGWVSVGPLRPGIRVDGRDGVFRVGNAAGESHPLIGEGISMALQSAVLLAATLSPVEPASIAGERAFDLQRRYAAAWHRAFAPRLRLAAVYAHVAMRPALARPVRALLGRYPALLRSGARLAGKAARAAEASFTFAEIA